MSPLVGTYPLAGPPAQMDDTDKLAVSLYAKAAAAGDAQLLVDSAANPNLRVMICNTTSKAAVNVLSTDIFSPSVSALAVLGVQYLYNGSTLERQRGNNEVTVSVSAARVAVLTTADQIKYNNCGAILIINVTARAAATTLTPTIQVKDPVSGEYVTVWTAAAAIDTADNTFTYAFDVGLLATVTGYTQSVNQVLPRVWRLTVTPSDANSVTYSVAVCYHS
jgi:hypothetical protein